MAIALVKIGWHKQSNQRAGAPPTAIFRQLAENLAFLTMDEP
jgi:hypothetical protein